MEASTGSTPKALIDRPQLAVSNRHNLEAFFELSAGRSMGDFGPHPISIADVHAYVQLTDLTDVEARLRFLALVRALDCVYLTHQAKKAK